MDFIFDAGEFECSAAAGAHSRCSLAGGWQSKMFAKVRQSSLAAAIGWSAGKQCEHTNTYAFACLHTQPDLVRLLGRPLLLSRRIMTVSQ